MVQSNNDENINYWSWDFLDEKTKQELLSLRSQIINADNLEVQRNLFISYAKSILNQYQADKFTCITMGFYLLSVLAHTEVDITDSVIEKIRDLASDLDTALPDVKTREDLCLKLKMAIEQL